MSDQRWRSEVPPLDAYSRVTNPERFEPIIPAILEIIDRLEETYDLDRDEGHGLDEELEKRSSVDTERQTIRLSPRNPGAAPITVAFSAFPGIHIRLGKRTTEAFPGCGCDACDETAESEIDRLTQLIHNVTQGHFREAMYEPRNPRLRGKGYYAYSSISTYERGANKTIRTNIESIKNWWSSRKKVREIHWEPWPLRR